ncbi:MAG: insulinase family protein [Alphaproteobacteria bacterium]|nr:insulinase family protein [Alphaproteobacteria bacterium]
MHTALLIGGLLAALPALAGDAGTGNAATGDAAAGDEAPGAATTATLDNKPAVAIPFEQYTLDNGLHVILSEDHSVPFVQVNLWYGVGSKDEVAGRTGFAHLFEHLMFQGSEHMNDDYFVPLQRIGARVNGTTNFDRTNFFEGVPSEQLPLALWLESDRMGWLLPALTDEKLENQKEVVRNERRQRYENTPYGEVWVWLFENLYPENHPYHVPTIGRHEDIEAATMEDVSAFFSTWYVPNNASLVISGDFDPSEAKTLVDRYFGAIPAGPQPTPVKSFDLPDGWLSEEVVVEKTENAPDHKVWIAWVSPKLYADGDAELDILSTVLSDGKESRLYQRLVKDKQIAKDVEAYQYSALLTGSYIIEATAAEGHTTDELVKEIDAVLAELRKDGPTADEVAVSKTNWQVGFYRRLLTIAGKADMLNSYYTWTGDPGYIGKDLRRYLKVTPASVKETANTWLVPGHRVVLHVRPEGGAE